VTFVSLRKEQPHRLGQSWSQPQSTISKEAL